MLANLHFRLYALAMRLTSKEAEILGRTLQDALLKKGVCAAFAATSSGVHPSRLSRILKGNFRTMNPNVVQICNFLNVSLAGEISRDPAARVSASALKLWDGSPEDADRLVSLFNQIAEVRGSAGR
jgi:hypothetical protein